MARIARRVAGTGLAALALCVGGAERADAQWFQGTGYVATGVSRIATGELDDRLAARGYPRFGRTAVAIGIGGYATVASRVMLGGEFTGLIVGDQEYQGRAVFLGGGSGTLGVGYIMQLSPRLRIFPRVGLGAGGLGLTFDSEEDSVGFDDVLADPDRQVDSSRGFQASMSRGHAVVDLGAGAEFLPSRSGRGPLIGLRLGWVIAPSNTSWQMLHRPVSGGPAASIGGPYVRVVIGLGAWR